MQKAGQHDRRFIKNRAVPLLALPLVAIGKGGQAEAPAELIERLVPGLIELAREHGVDLALVLLKPLHYAAVAACRRRLTGAWPDTPPINDLRRDANTLVNKARRGELVIFTGAGISAGANVPLWSELLKILAKEVDPPLLNDDFGGLDVMDQALIIQSRIDRQQRAHGNTSEPVPTLGQRVSEVVARHKHWSLCHLLLARLPVNEMVTTNYDELLEGACAVQGQPVAVLPYDLHGQATTGRWLLKLHGCVKHKEDIVLTRTDFIRYANTRAALRGIVQAMLMTRHMMFVGFPMKDHNLHQIMDDVRQAIGPRPDTSPPFGTCLSITPDSLMEEFWSQDVRWVTIRPDAGSTADDRSSLLQAARNQEIFLDYLANEASRKTKQFLDDRYQDSLAKSEKDLVGALRELRNEANKHERNDPAWADVWGLLELYGA